MDVCRYMKPLAGSHLGGTTVDFVMNRPPLHKHSIEVVFSLESAHTSVPSLNVKVESINTTVLRCETPPVPEDVSEFPLEAKVSLFIDGVEVSHEEPLTFWYFRTAS